VLRLHRRITNAWPACSPPLMSSKAPRRKYAAMATCGSAPAPTASGTVQPVYVGAGRRAWQPPPGCRSIGAARGHERTRGAPRVGSGYWGLERPPPTKGEAHARRASYQEELHAASDKGDEERYDKGQRCAQDKENWMIRRSALVLTCLVLVLGGTACAPK